MKGKKNLYIIFTLGVSLLRWEEYGIIYREMEIYNQYLKSGWEVTLLTYGDHRDELIIKEKFNNNFNIISLKNFKKTPSLFESQIFNFIYSLKAILILFKHRNNVSLLKTSQLYGCWVSGVISLICNKPWLSRTGYDFFEFLESSISEKKRIFINRKLAILVLRKIHKYFGSFASHMIVSSEKDFINTNKWFKKKISLNRNWVTISKENVLDFQYRSRELVKDKQIKALLIGRLEKQKRIDIAIKALELTNRSITLDIYGSGSEEAKLMEIIKRSKSSKIKLKGTIENKELTKSLRSYNLLISTSDIEGTPKAVLEAMGAGVLIFARECLGNTSLIKNGKNGYLFKDVEELKYLLENYSKNSVNDICKIITSAYNQVKDNHGINQFASNEIKIANSLLYN